jgi:hypothetical protein
MFALEEENELTVSDFKKRMLSVKPYLLSRHLTLLYEKKHIQKSGKVYTLNNDIFFKCLIEATKKATAIVRKKKNLAVSPEDAAMTASLFLSMIYDNVSNILIHLLLRSERPLSEIVEIYRRNHGYISSNIIRYHLDRKKFQAYGIDLEIFDIRAKRYLLTPHGAEIHKIYDDCMTSYILANEDWMRKIWSRPLKELVSDRVSMAQPGDKFYKVLRMLGKTDFVIIRSNQVEGVVTIQHAMSLIGKVMDKENFWGGLNAREVMVPIKDGDILSGNDTLSGVFKKKGEFTSLYYVVDVGGNNYNVLDMNKVFKILNNT